MRVPAAWKKPLEEGRLLILSLFAGKVRRVTAETSQARNAFVAALGQQIFVVHAAPGSKTEAFCKRVLATGKSVRTLDGPDNQHLVQFGVSPLAISAIKEIWKPKGK